MAFGAFIALPPGTAGPDYVLSCSPELFLRNASGRLSARPMKGTAPRAREAEGDRLARAQAAVQAGRRAKGAEIQPVGVINLVGLALADRGMDARDRDRGGAGDERGVFCASVTRRRRAREALKRPDGQGATNIRFQVEWASTDGWLRSTGVGLCFSQSGIAFV